MVLIPSWQPQHLCKSTTPGPSPSSPWDPSPSPFPLWLTTASQGPACLLLILGQATVLGHGPWIQQYQRTCAGTYATMEAQFETPCPLEMKHRFFKPTKLILPSMWLLVRKQKPPQFKYRIDPPPKNYLSENWQADTSIRISWDWKCLGMSILLLPLFFVPTFSAWSFQKSEIVFIIAIIREALFKT